MTGAEALGTEVDDLEVLAWFSNSPEDLAHLARHPHPWVRQGVAENRHTPVPLLERMKHDVERDIRIAAVENLRARGAFGFATPAGSNP